MPWKMQTTVSLDNNTVSQRKKECSKVIVGDTSPFIVKGWLVPRLGPVMYSRATGLRVLPVTEKSTLSYHYQQEEGSFR